MKKLAFFLVALMLVSLFAACTPSNEQSQSEQSTEQEVSQAEKSHLDGIKYDNIEIVVIAVGGDNFSGAEWAPEEMNDEPVNDATFERNALILQNHGIDIKVFNVEDYKGVVEGLSTQVDGGTDTYQFGATAVHRLATSVAEKGQIYNFHTLNDEIGKDYLHLDADYYDQTAVKDLSILNKLFFLTGDICITDNDATWATFFNKDIIKAQGLENPFDLVRNDAWDIDKMHEMAKDAHSLVGDKMDFVADTDDTWGIILQTYDGVAYMWGAQQSMVSKDDEDVPQFRILDERNTNVFANLFDMMLDMDVVGIADHYGAWDSGIYGVADDIFLNGHSLFYSSNVAVMSGDTFRNTLVDYGVIPMPKADKLQEDYYSHANIYSATVVSVPISNVDHLEETVFAIEAMSYYGKKYVRDVYYETTLKNKRTKDDDSKEMLDIIFSHRTWDLSAIFDWGSALYIYTGQIGDKNNTLETKVEGMMNSLNAARDKTVDAFRAID